MEEIERSPNMMIAAFKELWPQAFVDQNPPPLKIRITKDILDSGLPKDRPFTEREIQKGLQRYCNLPKYKKGLKKAGRIRIDLDGQPAGQVSPDEAEKAREKLQFMEQAKLDKARAKAEAAAALLAAKEEKKRKRAAERAAEKLRRQKIAAERYRLAHETPEERIARKKAKKRAEKRSVIGKNRLNRMAPAQQK
jgi:Activator of osmoprotectant transporter ProP